MSEIQHFISKGNYRFTSVHLPIFFFFGCSCSWLKCNDDDDKWCKLSRLNLNNFMEQCLLWLVMYFYGAPRSVTAFANPISGLCPVPIQSSLHPESNFSEILFIIVLPSTPRYNFIWDRHTQTYTHGHDIINSETTFYTYDIIDTSLFSS